MTDALAAADEARGDAGTKVTSDLRMLARWTSLGACAGGLAGVLIGGVGGRLGMLLLRVTSEDYIRGLESDDGFIMGRFTTGGTLSLLMVTAVLGSIAGMIVVAGRPFLPRRYMYAGWPLAAGAIVGATIIHGDGVDFSLLEPKALAVTMFVAIPAAGAFLMTWLIERWNRWWWVNPKRTALAAVAGLPSLVFFPVASFAGAVALAWLLVLRIDGARRLPRLRFIRALALTVYGALTALGLSSLGNDIRDVL